MARAESITEFRGDYRFLSNFYPAAIDWEGTRYPTLENAYQAAKCLSVGDRAQFIEISAGVAKERGSSVELRADWGECVKLGVMKELLRAKFAPGTKYADWLWQTGDALLVEGNAWGDTWWGQCPVGIGENYLGRLLMEVRSEIRQFRWAVSQIASTTQPARLK